MESGEIGAPSCSRARGVEAARARVSRGGGAGVRRGCADALPALGLRELGRSPVQAARGGRRGGRGGRAFAWRVRRGARRGVSGARGRGAARGGEGPAHERGRRGEPWWDGRPDRGRPHGGHPGRRRGGRRRRGGQLQHAAADGHLRRERSASGRSGEGAWAQGGARCRGGIPFAAHAGGLEGDERDAGGGRAAGPGDPDGRGDGRWGAGDGGRRSARAEQPDALAGALGGGDRGSQPWGGRDLRGWRGWDADPDVARLQAQGHRGSHGEEVLA